MNLELTWSWWRCLTMNVVVKLDTTVTTIFGAPVTFFFLYCEWSHWFRVIHYCINSRALIVEMFKEFLHCAWARMCLNMFLVVFLAICDSEATNWSMVCAWLSYDPSHLALEPGEIQSRSKLWKECEDHWRKFLNSKYLLRSFGYETTWAREFHYKLPRERYKLPSWWKNTGSNGKHTFCSCGLFVHLKDEIEILWQHNEHGFHSSRAINWRDVFCCGEGSCTWGISEPYFCGLVCICPTNHRRWREKSGFCDSNRGICFTGVGKVKPVVLKFVKSFL